MKKAQVKNSAYPAKAQQFFVALITSLEDYNDILAAKLSKNQKGRPYEEIRNEILKG